MRRQERRKRLVARARLACVPVDALHALKAYRNGYRFYHVTRTEHIRPKPSLDETKFLSVAGLTQEANVVAGCGCGSRTGGRARDPCTVGCVSGADQFAAIRIRAAADLSVLKAFPPMTGRENGSGGSLSPLPAIRAFCR